MNKVNARNKWSLSVGCVGRDLCYTLVSLFLLTYLQFTGLFDTTQFLVLSVIIVLCRVWDAVNDPMMGTIITNTKSRFGKYRPWVIIGALLNSIFFSSVIMIASTPLAFSFAHFSTLLSRPASSPFYSALPVVDSSIRLHIPAPFLSSSIS